LTVIVGLRRWWVWWGGSGRVVFIAEIPAPFLGVGSRIIETEQCLVQSELQMELIAF
jgi:hypothetical protein